MLCCLALSQEYEQDKKILILKKSSLFSVGEQDTTQSSPVGDHHPNKPSKKNKYLFCEKIWYKQKKVE